MKDLDLTTLRLFVEVCDAKSIKRVAEREQIDASAITKRMAKLEEQLQTPLLKRVRQGVEATPEGALFSEQARRLVNDARKLSDNLLQRKSGLSGTVTVASHMGSVSSVLPDDLALFMQLHAHEAVQLNVKEAISKDAVQMVRDGRAQIAVVWDNTETSDLQHVDYYSDVVSAVMTHAHPLAQRLAVRYEELMAYKIIADKHSKHTEALLQRSGGITADNARFAMQVETQQSALRMTAHGLGIYVCQAKAAQLQAAHLGLVVVPLSDSWARIRIKVVYLSNVFSPLTKALVDHLAHQHKASQKTVNPTSP
jgi:DNA-binding transcriptional LysR family regulator